jgi:hypothetical protein
VAERSFHPAGTAKRWFELSLVEQLGNIGSEVARAGRARTLGHQQRAELALARCLELFDLTLADERWQGRRKEITRAREVTCDLLAGDNVYGSTLESLDKYFLPYAMAARRGR